MKSKHVHIMITVVLLIAIMVISEMRMNKQSAKIFGEGYFAGIEDCVLEGRLEWNQQLVDCKVVE